MSSYKTDTNISAHISMLSPNVKIKHDLNVFVFSTVFVCLLCNLILQQGRYYTNNVCMFLRLLGYLISGRVLRMKSGYPHYSLLTYQMNVLRGHRYSVSDYFRRFLSCPCFHVIGLCVLILSCPSKALKYFFLKDTFDMNIFLTYLLSLRTKVTISNKANLQHGKRNIKTLKRVNIKQVEITVGTL